MAKEVLSLVKIMWKVAEIVTYKQVFAPRKTWDIPACTVPLRDMLVRTSILLTVLWSRNQIQFGTTDKSIDIFRSSTESLIACKMWLFTSRVDVLTLG